MAKNDVAVKFSLVDGVTAGLRNITKGLTETGKSIFFISEGATRAFDAIKKVAGIDAFTSGVRSAASLEDTLARIGARSNATAAQLAEMGKAAEQAAARTRFSTQEAAEALRVLSEEGQSANEALQSLPATLALAQAGATGAAEAAGILDDTLDQFQLSAGESGRAADTLVKAMQLGGIGAKQMADALAQVGPSAEQSNITLEETSAIIAALSKAGIEGGRAASALRGIFESLKDPASAFSVELRKIGISSTDFGEVIEQLAAKGKAGADAIASLNDRGAIALRALLVNGGADLRKLTTEIENSGGAAQAASDKLNNTFGAAMDRIGNAFENLKTKLAAPLLTVFAQNLEVVTGKLREFADSPEFAKLQTAITTVFTKAIEAVKKFAGEFSFEEAVAKIAKFASDAGTFFKNVNEAAVVTADAIKASAAAIATAIEGIDRTVAGLQLVGANIADKVTGVISVFSDEAARLRVEIRETRAEIEERFNGTVDEATKRLVGLGDGTGKAATGFSGVGTAAAQALPPLTGLSKEAQALANEINKAGTAALEQANSVKIFAAGTLEAAQKTKEASGVVEQSFGTMKQATQEQVVALRELGVVVSDTASESEIAWAKTSAAYRGGADALKDAAAAATETKEAVEETGEAGEAMGQQVAAGADAASGAAGGLAGIIQALNERFAAVSENARLAFVEMQRNAVRGESSLRGVIQAIISAGDATDRLIASQKAQAVGLLGLLQGVADSGEQAAGRIGSAFRRMSEEDLRDFAAAVRRGETALGILDQSTLDRLASEADAAADKIARIAEESREAQAALADLNNELANQLDQAAGNEEAIARRRYDERIAQIEDLARRGGEAALQQAQEARARAAQLLQQELEVIAQRRKAEAQANAEQLRERQQIANVGSQPAQNQPQRSVSNGGSSSGNGARSGPSVVNNYNVTVNNPRPEADARFGRRIALELARQERLRR